MSKIKLYTIWTEDQGLWINENVIITKNRKYAKKKLKDYCDNLEEDYWIEHGLAYIVELKVDVKDFEGK